MPKNFAQYMVPDEETIMAVPRVIGIALKRPLRIGILHACEKAMNNEYRKNAAEEAHGRNCLANQAVHSYGFFLNSHTRRM